MGVGSRPRCEPDVAYDKTRDSGWASVLHAGIEFCPWRSGAGRRHERKADEEDTHADTRTHAWHTLPSVRLPGRRRCRRRQLLHAS